MIQHPTFKSHEFAMAFSLPADVDPDLSGIWYKALERHLRSFKKGATLVMEGERSVGPVCVLDGWLSLSKSLENGQTQIIDFVLPGEIVDPTSADGTTAAFDVSCATDGAAAVFPLSEWVGLLHDIPELAEMVHGFEAAQQARRAERTLRLGKGSAEMRVTHALMEFCIRIGTSCSTEEPSYYIPMTQQTLGDFLGLSSVHICRTTRRLARNGILSLTDHMFIQIHDVEKLSEIAGSDPDLLRREIQPAAV